MLAMRVKQRTIRRYHQTAAHRHSPTMQSVGFDRVNLGAAPAGDIGGGEAEQQSPDTGSEERV